MPKGFEFHESSSGCENHCAKVCFDAPRLLVIHSTTRPYQRSHDLGRTSSRAFILNSVQPNDRAAKNPRHEEETERVYQATRLPYKTYLQPPPAIQESSIPLTSWCRTIFLYRFDTTVPIPADLFTFVDPQTLAFTVETTLICGHRDADALNACLSAFRVRNVALDINAQTWRGMPLVCSVLRHLFDFGFAQAETETTENIKYLLGTCGADLTMRCPDGYLPFKVPRPRDPFPSELQDKMEKELYRDPLDRTHWPDYPIQDEQFCCAQTARTLQKNGSYLEDIAFEFIAPAPANGVFAPAMEVPVEIRVQTLYVRMGFPCRDSLHFYREYGHGQTFSLASNYGPGCTGDIIGSMMQAYNNGVPFKRFQTDSMTDLSRDLGFKGPVYHRVFELVFATAEIDSYALALRGILKEFWWVYYRRWSSEDALGTSLGRTEGPLLHYLVALGLIRPGKSLKPDEMVELVLLGRALGTHTIKCANIVDIIAAVYATEERKFALDIVRQACEADSYNPQPSFAGLFKRFSTLDSALMKGVRDIGRVVEIDVETKEIKEKGLGSLCVAADLDSRIDLLLWLKDVCDKFGQQREFVSILNDYYHDIELLAKTYLTRTADLDTSFMAPYAELMYCITSTACVHHLYRCGLMLRESHRELLQKLSSPFLLAPSNMSAFAHQIQQTPPLARAASADLIYPKNSSSSAADEKQHDYLSGLFNQVYENSLFTETFGLFESMHKVQSSTPEGSDTAFGQFVQSPMFDLNLLCLIGNFTNNSCSAAVGDAAAEMAQSFSARFGIKRNRCVCCEVPRKLKNVDMQQALWLLYLKCFYHPFADKTTMLDVDKRFSEYLRSLRSTQSDVQLRRRVGGFLDLGLLRLDSGINNGWRD